MYVICQECDREHEAVYSHESIHGQGSIYAVVCNELTDYYTTELLYTKAA